MPTTKERPDGGFVFIQASLLIATWWAYKRRFIEFKDVRVWLASHELVASRCALKRGRVPHYETNELAALTHVKERIGESLSRLERLGLLAWSETAIRFPKRQAEIHLSDTEAHVSAIESVTNNRRKVPVPRRLLRWLSRSSRPAVVATALGHLLRCMYYRDGGCSPRGLCKASWIAERFEVDLRTVKAARHELEALGILLRHETPQWVMNRFGPRVEISLSWSPPGFVKRRKPPPPRRKLPAKSPPPDSNRELSSKEETRNAATPRPSGFLEEGQGTHPTLAHVRPEDLGDDSALRLLFEDAVQRGALRGSEHDRLRLFAAAEHARAKGTRNPPGLFVAILNRGLWSYITQREEDSARNRLTRLNWLPPPSASRVCSKHQAPRTTNDDSTNTAQIRELIARSLASAAKTATSLVSQFEYAPKG